MMSNDGLIIGNMDLSHIHLAVKKSYIFFQGGRCLAQEHCRGLTNSICAVDFNITLGNGLPLKTCQCMEGYLDLRYSCRQFSGDSVIKVGIICLRLWHGSLVACPVALEVR